MSRSSHDKSGSIPPKITSLFLYMIETWPSRPDGCAAGADNRADQTQRLRKIYADVPVTGRAVIGTLYATCEPSFPIELSLDSAVLSRLSSKSAQRVEVPGCGSGKKKVLVLLRIVTSSLQQQERDQNNFIKYSTTCNTYHMMLLFTHFVFCH
jgi:hypothetical protein